MKYHAILDRRAVEDVRRMPPALARYTVAQLVNLEAEPTALSRRSHFPFRERVQVFNFDFKSGGVCYVVNVLFQYGADEETLWVVDIPWQEATEWWE
jgi:hypothetical protein